MFQAQRESEFAGNRFYEVYTVVMLELLATFVERLGLTVAKT